MKSYLIYKHTNKINGKCYIGQTCYNNPVHRWHSDGSGYKAQQKFYRAILKYGWENFEHQVLVEGLTKQEADELEIAYIEQFDSIKHGYNLLIGGSGQTTQSKPIYQLSLTKEILAEYSSIREAASQLYSKTFSAARSSISKCCSGQLRQYKGFSWCFVNEYSAFKIKLCAGKTVGKQVYQLSLEKEVLNQYGSYNEAAKAVGTTAINIKRGCDLYCKVKGYFWCRIDDLSYCRAYQQPHGKLTHLIYQLDNAKNILNIFYSGRSALKAMRPKAVSFNNDILDCCRGIRLTAYGYYWCFAEDYEKFDPKSLKDPRTISRPVQQLDKKSFALLAEYNSAEEAASTIGKSNGAQSIRGNCRGITKTAFGYIWKYKEIV